MREVALRLLAADSGMEDVVARLRGNGEQASATDREHLRRIEENVKELQTYGRQSPSSLDAFVDDEERDQHELLPDDRTESPEGEALKQEVIGNIDEQVNKLPEPESDGDAACCTASTERSPASTREVADAVSTATRTCWRCYRRRQLKGS